MKKTKALKNLSLKKITISKLTNGDKIQGGSGICGPFSLPVTACVTCDFSNCRSCASHQANGC